MSSRKEGHTVAPCSTSSPVPLRRLHGRQSPAVQGTLSWSRTLLGAGRYLRVAPPSRGLQREPRTPRVRFSGP